MKLWGVDASAFAWNSEPKPWIRGTSIAAAGSQSSIGTRGSLGICLTRIENSLQQFWMFGPNPSFDFDAQRFSQSGHFFRLLVGDGATHFVT